MKTFILFTVTTLFCSLSSAHRLYNGEIRYDGRYVFESGKPAIKDNIIIICETWTGSCLDQNHDIHRDNLDFCAVYSVQCLESKPKKWR